MSLINRFSQTNEENFSSPNFIKELFSSLKHFLSMDKEDDNSIGLLRYKGSIEYTAKEMTQGQSKPPQSFISEKQFNPVNIPMFTNSQKK